MNADGENAAEHRIADTVAAAEELHDPLEGLVAQQQAPTVLPLEDVEAGKGGEGGVFQISNAEFIAEVFTDLPEGASSAVCSKRGSPKAADSALDFLKRLRPGPWQLSAINPNVNNDIKTVTATTSDQMLGFINRYYESHNLYYAPNPVRVKDKKASKMEVAAIEFLPGDLDPKEGEAPEQAKARFLMALKSFQPAPMFVVDSGNGVQVLWRLEKPILLPDPVMIIDGDGAAKRALSAEAQSIINDVEAHTKAAMEKLGSVAGTQNIDRILRLPGTVNLPTKAKIKAGRTACQSSLLAFNEFALCKLEDFPVPSGVTKTGSFGNSSANVGASGKVEVGGSANATINWKVVEQHKGWLKNLDDLTADFCLKGKVIVGHAGSLGELNFDLQQAGVAPAKPYQSWSEVTFALAAIFKSCGHFSSEQIAAALMADLPCNQHVQHQADKRRAVERAILRSHAEVQPGKLAKDGPEWRERRKDGSPLPSMHNARLAVDALGIECSHDTFHNKLLFGYRDDISRHVVEQIVGEVSDNGIIALRQLMSDTFGFDLTDKYTRDAVTSLALEHCFNPVVDMLAEAEAGWDGVSRLDRMAADFFNCEDTPLNAACMRKTLLAAGARARTPGIKFDQILVLEAEEGFNKSTAWRVLAGDENFSDENIIGSKGREVQEQLAEVWIHENADLAGLKKAEIETVKAYASRQVDIARPAYGHFVRKQPRHSIDVGTTNSDEYLQSQTGNRRFWPMRVLRTIDIEKLRRYRLQIWGEVGHCLSQGESLVLDEKLWADAGREQEHRRVKDPWEDILRIIPDLTTYRYHKDGVWHDGTRKILHSDFDNKEQVSAEELLTYLLDVPPGNQRVEHSMRLSRVMKKLDWKRHSNGYVTINGKRVKGYYRTSKRAT